jgi:hypothetical protein
VYANTPVDGLVIDASGVVTVARCVPFGSITFTVTVDGDSNTSASSRNVAVTIGWSPTS